MNRLSFNLYNLVSWLLVRKSGPPYYLTPLIIFILKDIMGYRKNMIARNMSKVFPEKSTREIKKMRSDFYRQLADTFAEMLYGYRYPEKIMERLEFENMELINKDIAEGKSVIASGGHFYNWEWAGISLAGPVSHPVYGIYKKISNPYFERYFLEARASLGIDLISTRDASKFIRDKEKKGEHSIYILAADQSPSYTEKAIWIEFFGSKLPFFPGIQKFVDLYGMSVYFIRIECPKRGFYKMTCEPLETIPDGYTQAFVAKVKEAIIAHPTSWLWSHNRWKHEQSADQFN